MHPPLDLMLSGSGWLSESEFRQGVGRGSPLLLKGLLTRHIDSVSSDGFVVRRIAQGPIEHENFHRRDIVIVAEGKICVVASTLLPAAVRTADPGLDNLGDSPIGEYLESTYQIVRGAFEFRALPDEDALASNFDDTGEHWLRRYRYDVPAGSITIVELISRSLADRLR